MKIRPEGLGLWIAYPAMALAQYKDWRGIARAVRALGGQWLAVRTTDPLLKGLALDDAISACRAEGLAWYSWHYSYPDAARVATQVAHMQRCRDAGAHGHIINAEIEFTAKPSEARRLLEAVRSALSNWYVGHAPLGWIDYHPTWPYEVFDEFCDDTHPQMYWTELKHGAYSTEFRRQIERWRAGFRHGAPHDLQGVEPGTGQRVCPIGVTYGRGDLVGTMQPPGALRVEDVRSFLTIATQVLPCVSLYSLEVATAQALEYLRRDWSWELPSGG